MKPSTRYLGSFLDHSGYGQANRSDIISLFLSNVNISSECVIQVPERATFGWTEELCKQLEGREIDFKIKIIHLTPDMYSKYREKDKYYIGRLVWETSHLPKEWIEPCNSMDEIWTMAPHQKEAMEDSGVKVPIYCFPEAIDVSITEKQIVPYAISDFKGYTFYSIFQWIERKNPRALLTAYWKAFEGKKDVCLLIKTYGQNYSEQEFERIKREVFEWKKTMNLTHYAKVFLVRKLLTTEEIWRLHTMGDCFVTATRGEGWGIPEVEASLLGKPLIGIDKTGVFDYLSKDDYYPVSTEAVEVTRENPNKWYMAPQQWREISTQGLIESMQEVYYNREEAKAKARRAREFVKDNFNYFKVGAAMKDRLEVIERNLNAK